LLAGDSATYLFGVIPVVHGSYSSSIIPAMLSTLLLKYVEKLVDRITPEWSKSFLKPLLIVMIVTPITLCAIAPLGLIIGNGLQSVINGIYGFAPWLAMMLFAGFMPFIVMTGMHWAFVPASMLGISGVGYDLMLLPAMLCSNTAQAGATFGAAFKTKDKEMKKMAFPAAVSALLAGVTEPAMYGVTLKLKKPMVAACISGGIGGLIVGILQVKSYAFVTPSMTSLVQFISPDGGKNFLYAVIIFAVTLVLSFVLSFILTKGEAEEEAAEETELQKSAAVLTGKVEIEAPVKGKVYAPFDGVCENLFDTLHAIGITSDNGIEMLIHVGLETVALKGEPFKAHTGNGEHFKKGALLLEFDIDAIQKAGCEIQTPVIITNAEELGGVTVENERLVIGG
jgi:PTS system beta-glucosides-specific IIC component